MVNIDDYPQLALISWSRTFREIDDEEAFALYESNWRFIELESMLPHETAFLTKLTNQYGHGILNV